MKEASSFAVQMKCTNFDKHACEGFVLNLAHKADMDTHTYSSEAISPLQQVNRQMEINLFDNS